MPSIQLEINEESYEFFQKVSINLSFPSFAPLSTFEIVDVRRPNASLPALFNQPAKIIVNGELIVTGFVTAFDTGYDKSSVSVKIGIRPKTKDLVDCNVFFLPGEWTSTPLLTICQNVCKPFNIDVNQDPNLPASVSEFFKQKIRHVDKKVYAFMSEIARTKGVMITSDPDGSGNVLITRTSTNASEGLIRLDSNTMEDGNIINSQARRTVKDLFSVVSLKYNDGLLIISTSTPTLESQRRVSAVGQIEVNRFRPLVFTSQTVQGDPQAQSRVLQEVNYRNGLTFNLTYTLSGWDFNGALWKPNTLISVTDTTHNLKNEIYLVQDVNFTLDEKGQGERTRLVLVRPETYAAQEIPQTELPDFKSFGEGG